MSKGSDPCDVVDLGLGEVADERVGVAEHPGLADAASPSSVWTCTYVRFRQGVPTTWVEIPVMRMCSRCSSCYGARGGATTTSRHADVTGHIDKVNG